MHINPQNANLNHCKISKNRSYGQIIRKFAHIPFSRPTLKITLSSILLAICLPALACTSALVGADNARYGRMLLWKHRDTGHQLNFVDKVAATDSTLAYVALFNAGDSLRSEAWIGFNEAGFAIMNTASYNLAPDTARVRDREGIIMTQALRRCRTVEDFTALLDSAIACGPMGIQANFGLFDTTGNGGYIEATDHTYTVYPLSLAPGDILIRSNYSYSGGTENRLGETRHCDAEQLLVRSLADRDIAPETFTDGLSRSFFNASTDKDFATTGQRWVEDRGDMIPRRTSSASVVIEGALPDEDPGKTMVMWVEIGFPPVSHVEAVTLDSIPSNLLPTLPGCQSQLSNRMLERRNKAFPRKNKNGKWLIDLNYLLPIMETERNVSLQNYEKTRKDLRNDY